MWVMSFHVLYLTLSPVCDCMKPKINIIYFIPAKDKVYISNCTHLSGLKMTFTSKIISKTATFDYFKKLMF